jgi:hypothetical protein
VTDAAPKTVDWLSIELDYRAGIKTLRDIAEAQGITHGAINKRAKRDGWTRDLKAKIQAKAEELVSKQAVSKTVSKDSRITERELVDANALLQATRILEQRKDVVKSRQLVAKLFAELDLTTDGLELMEQIGELMASPDEAGIDKMNDLYRKVISLPGRVDMAKKLVETLEKLINAERRVFNIKDDDGDGGVKRFIGEVRLVPLMRTIEHDA